MPDSLVHFEVLLRSGGTGRQPTARNVDQFRPDPEALDRCRRWLCAHGVTAHATDFSLACSASPRVFESLFGVKLIALEPAPGQPVWHVDGTIRVPGEIAALVEDVTL